MSRAWPVAARARWRLALSGLRPREVRSWLTRQRAAFASATVDAWAVGPSAEAHTVAAEAGLTPTATAVRRRRGRAPRLSQVRIYLAYRVGTYPSFSPSTDVLVSHLPSLGQEAADLAVQVARPLDLRDVAGAQGHVLRLRHCLAYVALERRRHDRVLAPPDEERGRLELAQALPEALRLLEVDLASCCVERGPPARREIRAQELVDAGRGVARIAAGDDLLDDLLDDRPRRGLDQPKLGAHEAQPDRPPALAQPRQRRRHQHGPPEAL